MKDSWASFSTRKLKGKNRLELLFFLLNSIVVVVVVVVIMMVIIIIIVAILYLTLHQEDIMRLVAARREW